MSTPRLDTLTYDQLCELGAKVESQKIVAYRKAETERTKMRGMLDSMLSTLQGSAVVAAKVAAQAAATAPTQGIGKAPQNGQHKIVAKTKASPTKGKKAPIKYRSGTNTWSGRGKTPAWLASLEKAGQPRAQFAV